MDHAWWTRIEAVFHGAADRPPEEREAYLRDACGGDESLLRQVRVLLESDARAGRAMQDAIGSEAARLIAPAGGLAWVGRRIGPWRVTRAIGEGGGGVVLEGARDDGRFEQTVAIKVLRLGVNRSEHLALFRRERRLLAQLEHPHIARLLDGGEIAVGDDTVEAPYLVMEHVEGRPITAYYADRRAGVRERLTGFLQVLDAVAYAHRRLVLHRDLKPDNILVTNGGLAKLLDFGVSQLLTDERGDLEAGAVAIGQDGPYGMTPEYASPEQLAGQSLAVESDVYSLGVVLFELLAGRHPYAASGTPTADVVRAVYDTPAPALGADSDLDAVVARAMEKDPARRYRSVEAFADDLSNYLARRPVTARPSTVWYRSRKFVVRHKWETAAVVMLTAAVAAGITGTAYEARRANRRVQELRQLAGSLLFQVHDAVESLPGSIEARELLVRVSAEHLDRLADDAGADPQFLLDMAASYERLAKLQGGPSAGHIGKPAEAIASYGKAIALYGRMPAARSGDRDVVLREAACWKSLGKLQELTGNSMSATDSLRHALDYAERAARLDGGRPPIELLDLYSTLGDLEVDVGEPVRALSHYRSALDGFERRAAAAPDLKSAHSVITATVRLGQAQTYLGDLDEARRAFERALGVAGPLADRNPNSMPVRRDVLAVTDRLAEVLGDPDTPNLGDSQAAARLYEALLPSAEAMHQADLHDVRAVRDLAEVHGNLADCLRDHEPARAIAEYHTALALYAGLPASYKTPNIRRYVAARERGLGLALANLEQYQMASAGIQHALAMFDELADSTDSHPGSSQDAGATLRGLGRVELRMGDGPAATAHLEKSVRLLEDAFHEHPADVSVRQDLSDAYVALASARTAAGDCRGADGLVAGAAALWHELEKTTGAGSYANRQLNALGASRSPCTALRTR